MGLGGKKGFPVTSALIHQLHHQQREVDIYRAKYNSHNTNVDWRASQSRSRQGPVSLFCCPGHEYTNFDHDEHLHQLA